MVGEPGCKCGRVREEEGEGERTREGGGARGDCRALFVKSGWQKIFGTVEREVSPRISNQMPHLHTIFNYLLSFECSGHAASVDV
jgi:hypothetical protein